MWVLNRDATHSTDWCLASRLFSCSWSRGVGGLPLFWLCIAAPEDSGCMIVLNIKPTRKRLYSTQATYVSGRYIHLEQRHKKECKTTTPLNISSPTCIDLNKKNRKMKRTAIHFHDTHQFFDGFFEMASLACGSCRFAYLLTETNLLI